MLLRIIDLFAHHPGSVLVSLPQVLILLGLVSLALLVGITFHEFSHAYMATQLGDDTARRLGRLSLDPRRHLDPAGTLMLLLVGFGWGRPVPVSAWRLSHGPRVGMALVSSAGPLANLVVAAVFALPFRLGWMEGLESLWLLDEALRLIIFYNIILAVFNLIPLAPLDGFKVLLGLLPRELAYPYMRTEAWGPGLLIAVIGADFFLGLGILWRVIGGLTRVVGRLIGAPML